MVLGPRTTIRIGYFVNQYPAVSHTFIRREIQALELLGVEITRYALRPSLEKLVHPEDSMEQSRTKYILRVGAARFLGFVFASAAQRPFATWSMAWLAVKIGYRSDRGVLRHLAYALEALVLANWCCQDGVQHIHAHFGTNSAAIAMLTSRLSGIPYSFTAHGSEEFEKAPMLSLDEKLRHAVFAVCVSSFGRSQLMRWSPPEEWQKIELVRCGVDGQFLQAHSTPPPSSTFVCVGRLGEHKGQLLLVQAVRRLREAGTICSVVLAGDGPMRANIEAAIQRSGLSDQISITGWVSGDRVKAEILAARALVLPSFSENMPVVIMETMALGRPVISTFIAGIPELVTPGTTGWLVPSGDESALADAMLEALATPVETIVAMGAAGRARIVEQHDVFKEALKLKRLFLFGPDLTQETSSERKS